MTLSKEFKDLDLSNGFLFAAALDDPETCQLVLEIILGFPVGKVQVRAEHSILYNSNFRSVRLDIYATSELHVAYNVEMQQKDQKNIPKRSRYHQAEMDVSSLKPGEDFNDLKPSYVIFICTFDPFGSGLYRYTFEERCLENGISLGDETKKLFLNTKGRTSENVPEELIHFLHYVENSTEQCARTGRDAIIPQLHDKITGLKQRRELEGTYMTLEEWLKDCKEEGMAEGKAAGKAEGVKRTLALINCMLADQNTADISRLQSDAAFYQEMLERYHL
ncbi:MAG: Rpn family recombination-promoting nuclease/putative transposase [Hungatella sp.]